MKILFTAETDRNIRIKLADLNMKVTTLERKLTYIESAILLGQEDSEKTEAKQT
jgi:hypothetical protein